MRFLRRDWRDAACWVVFVLVGYWFARAVLWQQALSGESTPSFDIYAYFYPNVLHALRSFQEGHGLLWNTFQNCGQPFFANPQTALLYPPNWLFLILDIDAGLMGLTVLHLSIGALGTYGLGRALELDRLSAVAGAIAFELGGASLGLAAWMPNISGAYAWMPVAVCIGERLLRTGTLSSAIALSVVLALQLFAGYPQVAFFTYQILLVRVLWTVAAKQSDWKAAALVVAAMGMAPLLAAVHLVPGIEFARESVRSAALAVAEFESMSVSWETFRSLVDRRATGPGTTFSIIACAVAGIGLAGLRRSPAVACYALLTVVFVFLSFDTFVSQAYRLLPMATMFRGPDRFLWPAGFCFSVLVALGVHAVRTPSTGRSMIGTPVPAALAWRGLGLVFGAGVYVWLAGGTLRNGEWALLAALLLAVMIATTARRFEVVGAISIVVFLAASLFPLARSPLGMLANASGEMARNSAVFEIMQERVTNADRILSVGLNTDYSLMHKAPALFGMRGIADYEPMTSLRYAEFYVKMSYGAAQEFWMQSLNQFYYLGKTVPRSVPLISLVGTRFLAVDEKVIAASGEPPRFPLLQKIGSVGVYENAAALPRAFFVPSVDVVPVPRDLLRRLASRNFPVRNLALLAEPPADGFYGAANSTGSAEILSDRSEELSVRVRSTEGGFLFVSDQYYPGWTATVDETAVPVLLANYAFRLVRIPAGESLVVFRYAPASLRLGAGVSLASVLAIAIAGLVAFLRNRDVRRGAFQELLPPSA
jgi:hypothetical protein